MQQLINIFVDPGKVFSELKEKPTFLLPLLILTIGTALMTVMYFSSVDSDWFMDQALAKSGKEMSAEQIDKAKEFMPAAKTQGYIGAVTIFVFVPLVGAIYALYLLLAGKIAGTAFSFRQGFSLFAWSGMPGLLGMVLVIVGILNMSPQTTLESLQLANIDPLIVNLPSDSAWKSLASSFSLLTFWSMFLAALGWRTWTNSSWASAVVVTAMPYILIYGGMAVYAAL